MYKYDGLSLQAPHVRTRSGNMGSLLGLICFCFFVSVHAQETIYERVEYNTSYERYQNIKKSLRYNDTVWLKYRNYNTTSQMNNTCIYARRVNQTGDTLFYNMGYTNGTKKVTFQAYVTLSKSNSTRNFTNVMEVKRNKSSTSGIKYTLVYYTKGFGILRVGNPKILGGNGCEVHVRQSNITHDLPRAIQNIYRRACGTQNFTVYKEDCAAPDN